MLKICLDLDNVLMATNIGFINYLKKLEITEKLENCKYYEYWKEKYTSLYPSFYNDPEQYLSGNISFYEGARGFLENCISEFGVDNIQISSMTYNFNVAEAKYKVIKELIKQDISFTHPTSSKYLCTKDYVLVEDSYINIIQHVKVNKNPAIMFNYKNENPYCFSDLSYLNIQRPYIFKSIDYNDLFQQLKSLSDI